jgi:LysM repeat protein
MMDRRQFFVSLSGLLLGIPLLSATEADVYVVRKGDTLSKIARRYDTTVQEIRQLNGIKGDLIQVGQRLRIPPAAAVLAPVRAVNRTIRLDLKKWKYIVAHHSATAVGSARSFDRSNRQHGMKNGLAYHFVIGNGRGSPDGLIEVGSRWRQQLHGGHVSKWEFNNHGIGICLVGNFENTRPTAKQMDSLHKLITFLGGNLLNNRYQFYVHREINPTLCPGKLFPTARMHEIYG